MMTEHAKMTYFPQGEEGPEFQWHGGAYIEIGYTGESGFKASDVINVWDYAKDEPTIARTLEAFQAAVDEWLADNEEEGY